MAGNVRVVLKSVFDDKGIKAAQNEFGKVGKTIGVAFAAVGATLTAAGAAAVKFGLDAAKGAEDAAIAQRRLDQIAESMGLFGAQAAQVSKRLGEFAEANELIVGVDADVIKSTQAKLLTFKNLAQTAGDVGGAMDRATMAAVDLAAAGFGSAETNAVQLGKALQDPIKGITALGRAGVTFTEQEREKIKVLVESGKVLDAQNIILESIETQVGGTAEATASAFTRIQLATNQVKDAIGEALLPVVEDFADQLALLVPELSRALAPAAQQVATVLVQNLLPAIEAFGNWLRSPAGIKAVQDLSKIIVDSVKGFFDLARVVVENWEAIKTFTGFAIGATVAIKGMTTAISLARGAQLLFNVAVKANPFVALATAVITAATAMTLFAEEQKKARIEATGFQGRIGELAAEQKRLKELLDAGVISYADYKKAIGPVNSELAKLQGELEDVQNKFKSAGKYADALNKIDLSQFRGQLGDTRLAARDFASEQRELFFAMRGMKPPPLVTTTTTTTTTTTGNKKAVDETEKAFERVQKIVKATQKRITQAQGDYDKAVAKANKDYTEQIVKLREDYAKRLEQIVVSSQNRLRDAFRAAIGTSLSDLFGQEGDRSVTKLIENLRNRVVASRQLIENSSALASLGFTQTFIEQVVSAGVETGNELARAILQSTPEAQAELRNLFGALENTSERGMDQLAKRIYEEQGLATQELRNLYKNTNIELENALVEQQVNFQRTLQSAAESLGEKLRDIKADFAEDVAELGGAYGGLKGVIDGVSRSLDSMIGKADSAAKAAADAAIKAANATRAAIGDITGTTPSSTDLGLGTTASGSEGLRGFGDPLEMRRLAAIQAAGSALGQFGQGFINMVTGQRSFSKGGQVVAVSGTNERRAAELLAQGFVETFANNIDKASLDLALSLAEQVYGVDIGGISTPGQVGGNTFNITVNAGMGTDPITVGKEIVDAIKRFERSSGQVFIGV